MAYRKDWYRGVEKENKMTKNDEPVNLFGVLANFMLPEQKEPEFVFETKAWKGLWDFDFTKELAVRSVHGYRIDNWKDDAYGGLGLCFFVDVDTPKGSPISFQIIVPKDELIKALALLTDPIDEDVYFDW